MLPYPHFGSSLRRWGAGRGQLGEGEQALVGSVVSVWALYKGIEQLYAKPCHRHFSGDFWNFDTLKVGSSVFKANKTGFSFSDINSWWPTRNWLRKDLAVRSAWLLSFTSEWEGWLQVPGRLKFCWELSHAWCLLDHDWPDEALSERRGVFVLLFHRCYDLKLLDDCMVLC